MANVTRQKQTNWLGLLLLTVICASLCAGAQAQSNYYYTAPVADFPTTSATWTAVTSCSLSFTPGSTAENWLVMATGQVRSTSTSDPQEAHVRLRVGGTVEAEGGVNQSPANAESGFFMMHRITGTTALQSIDVQAQDPFANSSTTTVEQCSITAFLVPSNADFQWTEVPGVSGNCPDTPDTTILTHSFTPSSAGDYLFVTSLMSFENPGGVGNRAWVTYPSGAEAPDFNVENAWTNERDARQSYVSMRKETLGASLQTLSMTCDGSTGTAPNDKSTILWAKAASFRVDAFGAGYHGEDLTEVSLITSSTWATHSTVTQTAPSVSSEFIMLGTISGCTNSATGGPQHGMRFREDSTVQGDSVWGTTRDCSYSSGLHNSFQWVEPYTTASAKTWDNQYQSTDNLTEARFAESAIHVLQFPQPDLQQVHYRWREDDGGEMGGLNGGTGADGPVTISTSQNINTDLGFTVTTAASFGSATGGTTLTVAPGTGAGFAAGNEVFLINMQGDSTNKDNTGNYEFLTIGSISTDTLTFTTPIQKLYGATSSNLDLTGQSVAVQRVPQWTNVTITSTGTLTANAWDGTSGGLLVFRANGTVDINASGSIQMSAKGYRGGTGGPGGASTTGGLNGESYEGSNGKGGDGGLAGTLGGGSGSDHTGSGNTAGTRGGGAAAVLRWVSAAPSPAVVAPEAATAVVAAVAVVALILPLTRVAMAEMAGPPTS